MATVPTVQLQDGNTIPQLGFGVYLVKPDETVSTVQEALQIGYRHIDTAEMYRNEQQVGEAIRQSGIEREKIFITSKLNNGFHEPEKARAAFQETLDALGTSYVDLFLIHWPLPTRYDGDFVSTWKTLIEFKEAGKARSIGVSNFQVPHLERLEADTNVVPAVNQVELHPYFQNRQVAEYCAAHGIALEAWSPIAQGSVLEDPVLQSIADIVGRTTAQVVLRWHIQKGYIIFPKSVTPERIAENFALFDFELTAEQMASIDQLDKAEAGRTGPNPDTFDMVPGA